MVQILRGGEFHYLCTSFYRIGRIHRDATHEEESLSTTAGSLFFIHSLD